MKNKQIPIQKLAVGDEDAMVLSAENPCDIIFNITTRSIYVEGIRFGGSEPQYPSLSVTGTGL